MNETSYLLIAIGSLATAVVTLWVNNNKLHKKYSDASNENLLKMTDAMTENAKSNEHLANAIDDLKQFVYRKK